MNLGYRWATSGDVNAYFGLLLDNIAGLVLMVGLLVGGFGMPEDFVLSHMVPGTAIGVLVGDLLYFFMALQLAQKTGRQEVTAMPLGLDTPSIFGLSIFVVGASFWFYRHNNPRAPQINPALLTSAQITSWKSDLGEDSA